MRFVRSVALCFSMFSVLPMPRVEWKEDNMNYILAALPLVGAVTGLALWLWSLLCRALAFGSILYAAGMTVLPLLLSGLIHMDGFCDTADALASRASLEKKRAILKDPHAGAFAVITAGLWLLIVFALHTELDRAAPSAALVFFLPVFSRCFSALASLLFPGSGQGGLLQSFRTASRGGAVTVAGLFLVLSALGAFLAAPGAAVAVLCAGLLCPVYLFFMSRKQFGGMSGDLAGWLLETAELVMLLALILFQKAGML